MANTTDSMTTVKIADGRNPVRSGSSGQVCRDHHDANSSSIDHELSELATEPMGREEMSEAFHNMIAADQRGEYALRDEIHEKIIRSMYRLLLKIAHRTFNWHNSYYYDASIAKDDYEQEGCLALYKAIDKFNPDNGTCLSTYATTVIKHHLNEFASIRKRRNGNVREIRSMEEVYGENWAERIDNSIDEEDDSIEMTEEAAAALWDGIGRLSPKERDCLCARYDLSREYPKLANVAAKYGITPARASQITRQAFEKIRKHLVDWRTMQVCGGI